MIEEEESTHKVQTVHAWTIILRYNSELNVKVRGV